MTHASFADFTATVYYQISYSDLYEPNLTQSIMDGRTANLIFDNQIGDEFIQFRFGLPLVGLNFSHGGNP